MMTTTTRGGRRRRVMMGMRRKDKDKTTDISIGRTTPASII